MNVLIYTTDSIYKQWLLTAFHEEANKTDIVFDIANLVDTKMYQEQKSVANYNLIIFDEDSFSLDYILKVLLNCNDSDKNIIYLRTVKFQKYMIEHTRKRIRDIMRKFYPDSMWVLQDIVELCNIINKLNKHKQQITIKQDSYGFIDNDNILDYSDFLKNNYNNLYEEGICLLKQSEYIISVLNEGNRT